MSDWEYLERIISGDWRPHLVEHGSEELREIFKLSRIYIKHYSLDEISGLIDLSYPAPFSYKTDFYYWFIRLETETLKNGIQN